MEPELIIICDTLSTTTSNISSKLPCFDGCIIPPDVSYPNGMVPHDASYLSDDASSAGSNNNTKDSTRHAIHSQLSLEATVESLAISVTARCTNIANTIAATPLQKHKVKDNEVLSMYDLMDKVEKTYLQLEALKTTLRELAYDH